MDFKGCKSNRLKFYQDYYNAKKEFLAFCYISVWVGIDFCLLPMSAK